MTSKKQKNGKTSSTKNVLISSHAIIFLPIYKMNDAIEAIIHLGACSDTLETDGNYLMENNFRYTIRLAEQALKNDVRFIYASSAATYGDGK